MQCTLRTTRPQARRGMPIAGRSVVAPFISGNKQGNSAAADLRIRVVGINLHPNCNIRTFSFSLSISGEWRLLTRHATRFSSHAVLGVGVRGSGRAGERTPWGVLCFSTTKMSPRTITPPMRLPRAPRELSLTSRPFPQETSIPMTAPVYPTQLSTPAKCASTKITTRKPRTSTSASEETSKMDSTRN